MQKEKKCMIIIFRDYGIDYLGLRCWIGLWVCVILLAVVVTNMSFLVKYITRFTGMPNIYTVFSIASILVVNCGVLLYNVHL